MNAPVITLEPVRPEDMPAYKQRLQDTFTQAARKAFSDWTEAIPPERDIQESLDAPGAEALQVMHDGTPVGGAIVTGEGADKMLDFLFIDTAYQDQHFGYATWCAIEARYPDAARWELVTPYHEKRNVHFYVNRCGFTITEYFNPRHPDPHFPADEADDFPGADDGLFKFEKVLTVPSFSTIG